MSTFVLCINNQSNPASLMLGKVYQVLPDADAARHHLVRIIDEDTSEPEGYLYPESLFVPIDLPEVAAQALLAVGTSG